jgi:hypothetical protein
VDTHRVPVQISAAFAMGLIAQRLLAEEMFFLFVFAFCDDGSL